MKWVGDADFLSFDLFCCLICFLVGVDLHSGLIFSLGSRSRTFQYIPFLISHFFVSYRNPLFLLFEVSPMSFLCDTRSYGLNGFIISSS